MGRSLSFFLVFQFLVFSKCLGQDIYVVNSVNELKIIDTGDFSVTDLFAIDIVEFGYITDLAFAPDGSLYGVTNARTIIGIDLGAQSAHVVTNLPGDGTYTSLVCNAQNELLTSKFLQLELLKYDLDSGETTFLADGISSPGDFTYYKGNLIYPNIFNDFIRAWDGENLYDVGCSVPLLYSFVNVFDACNQQLVYGIDEDAVIYRYDLDNDSREIVANLLTQTGQLFGGATRSEYQASACPLEILNEVECTLTTAERRLEGISLMANVVGNQLVFEGHTGQDLHYQIRNTAGQLVAKGMVEGKVVGTGHLASGLYFIWLENHTDNRYLNLKFIKQ